MTTPSMCTFTWRLHGERRLVQCHLPFNHGGSFHQVGIHVTPADPTCGDCFAVLPYHAVGCPVVWAPMSDWVTS